MDTNKNRCQTSACSCLNLRRAANMLTKTYDRFLEPSGLKISQYSLIRAVSRLEPVNVSDLAAELKLDRTTLVRNLSPLEGKGLVADRSSKGSRDRQLVLTEQGKKTIAAANSLWQEAQRHFENYLGKEDLQTLSMLLLKIERLAE